MTAAGEAGQVAAVDVVVCQVEMGRCHVLGPREWFAAFGAWVAWLVCREPARSLALVLAAVATLGGGALGWLAVAAA